MSFNIVWNLTGCFWGELCIPWNHKGKKNYLCLFPPKQLLVMNYLFLKKLPPLILHWSCVAQIKEKVRFNFPAKLKRIFTLIG